MRVHELIEKLQAVNQNQNVWITTPDHNFANQLPLYSVTETTLLGEQVVLIEYEFETENEIQYALEITKKPSSA